jgi:hypothetical protein
MDDSIQVAHRNRFPFWAAVPAMYILTALSLTAGVVPGIRPAAQIVLARVVSLPISALLPKNGSVFVELTVFVVAAWQYSILAWIVQRWVTAHRWRRYAATRCQRCGFDLTGVPRSDETATCPECGEANDLLIDHERSARERVGSAVALLFMPAPVLAIATIVPACFTDYGRGWGIVSHLTFPITILGVGAATTLLICTGACRLMDLNGTNSRRVWRNAPAAIVVNTFVPFLWLAWLLFLSFAPVC